MRLIALLCIALLVTASASLARDFAAQDGQFSICLFRNFEKCELLTERTIQSFRLSAVEKRILRELKQHTEATQTLTLADLEKSFGKSYNIFRRPVAPDAPNDMNMIWSDDPKALSDPKSKCPACGIQMYFSNNVLTTLNYIAYRKFMIVWYRAANP